MRVPLWIHGLMVTGLVMGSIANAQADQVPVRSSTQGAVWSTSTDSFRRFVQQGSISDRGLAQLIARSGWTADELRGAFSQLYAVQLESVAFFLNSEAGVLWLRNQTRSYTPYSSLRSRAPEALRAAILADAADGKISASGIINALPTDFRLTRGIRDLDGIQNVCALARCEDAQQCTSLLSWFYFLPACIQANATTGMVDQAFDEPRGR